MSTDSLIGIALGVVAGILILWILWAWLRLRTRSDVSSGSAYTRGLTALIAGDRRGALLNLKEAVQEDSDNIDAYIRLGDLLRTSGEAAKALAVHRDLTVRPKLAEGDRVRILESLTQDYLAAGRYEEAGQTAERLRQINRNLPFAHEALRRVAEALEDWPRAIAAMTELERLSGGDKGPRARYLCTVAKKDLAANRETDARKRFEEALKLDPACTEAHLHLGDLHRLHGDSDKAIASWRSLAFESPERAEVVFERLERAYFELGQFSEVIGFYRELLHRMPGEHAVPALLALAEIHRRKGDLDEAESFVQEALDLDPGHPRAHRHGIKLALDRRDPDEALSRLEAFLATTDAPPDAVESPQPEEGE